MRRLLPAVILAYTTCLSFAQAQTKGLPVAPCTEGTPYTMTDGGPYDQLNNERDPNKRLALLDNFIAQNKPSPTMLVYIYPLYYRSYNEVKNFRRALEYADKLLALGDVAGVAERYFGLREWAFAYNNIDSDDPTLAAKALVKTREGIEAARQIRKPECVDTNTFEAQKRLAIIYFHAAAGAAAMKLKDYPAASDSFKAIVTLQDVPWPPVPQAEVRK